MKKLLPLAVAVLTAAFLVTAVLSVGFLSGLDQIWTSVSDERQDGRVVAVLLPSERDPFWDDLVLALSQSGARRNLHFELVRYNPSGSNARELIEKTALSGVDALVCYPPDGVDVSLVVNAAAARGLPVLLLENDLPNSRRKVFLGASSFQIGYEVGRLIRQRLPLVRRGGIVLSQSNLSRQTVRNSLFLNGLQEGLEANGPLLELEEVISPPGRFAGEELVWSLLRKDPPIQVLVTTNPKDTSSALQTIVEANKVGKTRLIGVGEDPLLRASVSEGTMAGLITRNPAEWAALLSATLVSVLDGEAVSSYVNLPVHGLSFPERPLGN